MSRFIFVVSTAGSVMNATLASDYLRSRVHSVVADRPCGAIDKARAHGVEAVLFEEPTIEGFCSRLGEYMREHGIEWVISFYTNFYSEAFRSAHRDRILNFHPSLLPAFKGMDGFGDGMGYHVKLIGTTVELIKDVMDEGKIVMQTVTVRDPRLTDAEMRHKIFVQQCKTLLQVVQWVDESRVCVEGDRVTIEGARYDDVEFSPALELPDAVAFTA